MSARTRASATASLPEMRSSLSSATAGAVGVTTAIAFASSPLEGLVVGVLAGDAGRDLHPARVQVPLQLLLVLAAEAEAVRADGGLLVPDLRGQPGLVSGLVVAPHLPLAGVVLEHRLVDHRDAVLHRAHRLADAAPAAGLHVGVEGAVGHHVEAG